MKLLKILFLGAALIAVNVLAGVSPSSHKAVTLYDIAGRVTATIAPGGTAGPWLATRNTYDPQTGLLARVESGSLTAWNTTPANWLSSSSFNVKSRTDYDYDEFGRKTIEKRIGEDNNIYALTQLSYDSNSRVQCKAGRMNPDAWSILPVSACTLGTASTLYREDRITKYTYDNIDNVTEEWRAWGTSLQQRYSTVTYSGTRPASFIDANGNKTQLEYDNYKRLWKRLYPPKTSTGAINSADYNEYRYDANGNMEWERKRNTKVFNYEYDNNNRMAKKDVPDTTSKDIYYSYDNRGLTFDTRYGNNQGLFNTFDGFGNVASTNNTMAGRNRTLNYRYDKNNNRTRLTHHDNKYATYWFDELNRSYRIQLNGSTQLWNEYGENGKRDFIRRNYRKDGAITDYGYEPSQRLASIKQNFAGTTLDNTYSFQYNPANQVKQLTISNDTFHYMGNDNHTGSYTPNGLNQYTSINDKAVSHDDNGNLIEYNGTTYTYDNENRLISTSGTVNSTFEYDPLGRLFKTTIDGVAREFLYDGDALIAEYEDTTLRKRYIHGDQVDEPLVEYIGSGTSGRRFLHADQRGSIIAISNQAGTAVNTLTYDTFGIPGAENVGRFGYTGQIYFPELGLYYYKARMYNPYIGRFMQTDPIFYEDQMNMYAYVGNDPVNMVDPTGKIRVSVAMNLKLAYQGGASLGFKASFDTVSHEVGLSAQGSVRTGAEAKFSASVGVSDSSTLGNTAYAKGGVDAGVTIGAESKSMELSGQISTDGGLENTSGPSGSLSSGLEADGKGFKANLGVGASAGVGGEVGVNISPGAIGDSIGDFVSDGMSELVDPCNHGGGAAC